MFLPKAALAARLLAAESRLAGCIIAVTTNPVTGRALSAGTAHCTDYNSILHFNYYTLLANHSRSAFYWSCTTSLPPEGVANTTNAPGLFCDLEGGIRHLQCGSLCIGGGIHLAALITEDLRGRPRPIDEDGNAVALFDMGACGVRPG